MPCPIITTTLFTGPWLTDRAPRLPAVRAALPDGCEPPPDGADSYELDMWRDDGSQVASVEECWHHCELNLGSMLVGSAPNLPW